MIHFYALSKKGSKSPRNEDNLSLPENNNKMKAENLDYKNKGYFFTLCDGLGGHLAGEVASKLCSEWLMKDYYETDIKQDIKTWLREEIENVNKRIYELSLKNEKYTRMGTTFVSLLIKDETAYINNVGDSRLYYFRNNKLEQITDDHSIVWEYYKNNLITKDDILRSNEKHIITQAMGLEVSVKINDYDISLPDKYLFLLCSDGLTDVTFDKDIEGIIKNSKSLKECVEKLYEISQKNLSRDDVTLILVSNYLT
ncbi:MAG: serine/threonine-protein phosphatase [Candidatus Cloacimonetes bacterium]|nr:serine/threonine-protein phosphatase [Candidatus Cloacimonadota bacterium]